MYTDISVRIDEIPQENLGYNGVPAAHWIPPEPFMEQARHIAKEILERHTIMRHTEEREILLENNVLGMAVLADEYMPRSTDDIYNGRFSSRDTANITKLAVHYIAHYGLEDNPAKARMLAEKNYDALDIIAKQVGAVCHNTYYSDYKEADAASQPAVIEAFADYISATLRTLALCESMALERNPVFPDAVALEAQRNAVGLAEIDTRMREVLAEQGLPEPPISAAEQYRRSAYMHGMVIPNSMTYCPHVGGWDTESYLHPFGVTFSAGDKELLGYREDFFFIGITRVDTIRDDEGKLLSVHEWKEVRPGHNFDFHIFDALMEADGANILPVLSIFPDHHDLYHALHIEPGVLGEQGRSHASVFGMEGRSDTKNLSNFSVFMDILGSYERGLNIMQFQKVQNDPARHELAFACMREIGNILYDMQQHGKIESDQASFLVSQTLRKAMRVIPLHNAEFQDILDQFSQNLQLAKPSYGYIAEAVNASLNGENAQEALGEALAVLGVLSTPPAPGQALAADMFKKPEDVPAAALLAAEWVVRQGGYFQHLQAHPEVEYSGYESTLPLVEKLSGTQVGSGRMEATAPPEVGIAAFMEMTHRDRGQIASRLAQLQVVRAIRVDEQELGELMQDIRTGADVLRAVRNACTSNYVARDVLNNLFSGSYSGAGKRDHRFSKDKFTQEEAEDSRKHANAFAETAAEVGALLSRGALDQNMTPEAEALRNALQQAAEIFASLAEKQEFAATSPIFKNKGALGRDTM